MHKYLMGGSALVMIGAIVALFRKPSTKPSQRSQEPVTTGAEPVQDEAEAMRAKIRKEMASKAGKASAAARKKKKAAVVATQEAE